MDGASYHKRITNPSPKSSSRKIEIQDWLKAKGVDFDPKLTKVELLEIVRKERGSPQYAPQQIASEYGHTLYYTPPYHPELHPTEIVWGIIKQKMAQRVSKSMEEMGTRLSAHMSAITSTQWLSAFRKVQTFEDKYASINDDILPLAGSDDESEGGGDDDLLFLLGEESHGESTVLI
ncbi:hypothetical protein LEN26_009317 [Aphanomyces euteiches]|nr:hypothetical protein AeMF1_019988 [Aphanomyces euteiches]KAH9126997.1 hypothetical protein LEN26_009317 [Aphanomyces euteiches]KAH9183374.1 hypothetical protein AeNC1_014650 [Aphanomyces euteiches]